MVLLQKLEKKDEGLVGIVSDESSILLNPVPTIHVATVPVGLSTKPIRQYVREIAEQHADFVLVGEFDETGHKEAGSYAVYKRSE